MIKQAKLAIQNERFKGAVGLYRKALALKPDSADAKAGLGIALVNGSGSDSALREAVEAAPGRGEGAGLQLARRLALGIAYQFTNRAAPAAEAYRKYLLLEPTGSSAGDVRAMLKELGQ